MKIAGNMKHLKELLKKYGNARVETVCEMQELESKAWLALQRGHYKMFGRIAAEWHQANKRYRLWLLDPFLSIRNMAGKVRV